VTEIKARFEIGDSVALVNCPSVGVIVEAELENLSRRGYLAQRWFYRIDWPQYTNDNGWYPESELVRP
jgi:hypothetical protein